MSIPTPSTGRCGAGRRPALETSGPGESRCTPSPSRLDPESYFALARALFAEMALSGVTAVGEFHYLHHGPGGSRYSDPERDGPCPRLRRRRGWHTHHPARHLLPQGRFRSGARRGAATLRGRLRRGVGRARRGAPGGPAHADRRRRAQRPGRRRGLHRAGRRLGARSRGSLACARFRAACRERGLSGHLRPHAGPRPR